MLLLLLLLLLSLLLPLPPPTGPHPPLLELYLFGASPVPRIPTPINVALLFLRLPHSDTFLPWRPRDLLTSVCAACSEPGTRLAVVVAVVHHECATTIATSIATIIIITIIIRRPGGCVHARVDRTSSRTWRLRAAHVVVLALALVSIRLRH